MTKRRQHEKSRKHSTHECMPGRESHSGHHLFNKHGRSEESVVHSLQPKLNDGRTRSFSKTRNMLSKKNVHQPTSGKIPRLLSNTLSATCINDSVTKKRSNRCTTAFGHLCVRISVVPQRKWKLAKDRMTARRNQQLHETKVAPKLPKFTKIWALLGPYGKKKKVAAKVINDTGHTVLIEKTEENGRYKYVTVHKSDITLRFE